MRQTVNEFLYLHPTWGLFAWAILYRTEFSVGEHGCTHPHPSFLSE